MSQMNWPAIGCTILPNVGGVAGGIFARKSVENWYATLKKPEWRPPNAAFGPVWTSLYSSMGYASYLVYRDGDGFNGPARLPLIVYGSNVLLNWAWTPIFFGAKDPQLALAEIQLVNLTALGTGYLFYKINPIAGYLIIPYCLWLGLATALNYVIWRDNKDSKPKITEVKEK
ncbi:translocator protein isoform X1 [Anoplophora glabripennis]|uniref:translocator protein isoform X1 n=1 Tax=Anoplophora glabripennis TaxID=217634 RepID=UPI000874709C|nr:translocator protein isoform X1 [Anoplophora glabripennis]